MPSLALILVLLVGCYRNGGIPCQPRRSLDGGSDAPASSSRCGYDRAVAKTGFKLNAGWKKFQMAVDPETFKKALNANLARSTQLNAMMYAAEIRRRIIARRYAPNSAFTILLKKSSKPLVNDGDLLGAITHRMIDEKTALVGVLRSSGKVNLAELLHEGGTIHVTEAMRRLFGLLAAAGADPKVAAALEGRAAEMAKALGSRLKRFKPLKASTKALVIPPRPFLREVFEDPGMHKKAKKNWEKGLAGAVKQQVGKAKAGKPKGPPNPKRVAAAKAMWEKKKAAKAGGGGTGTPPTG